MRKGEGDSYLVSTNVNRAHPEYHCLPYEIAVATLEEVEKTRKIVKSRSLVNPIKNTSKNGSRICCKGLT